MRSWPRLWTHLKSSIQKFMKWNPTMTSWSTSISKVPSSRLTTFAITFPLNFKASDKNKRKREIPLSLSSNCLRQTWNTLKETLNISRRSCRQPNFRMERLSWSCRQQLCQEFQLARLCLTINETTIYLPLWLRPRRPWLNALLRINKLMLGRPIVTYWIQSLIR